MLSHRAAFQAASKSYKRSLLSKSRQDAGSPGGSDPESALK